jgi:hypothetical protein
VFDLAAKALAVFDRGGRETPPRSGRDARIAEEAARPSAGLATAGL